MFDIYPNWHPAAVHFPIALGCVAALLFALAAAGRGGPTLAASARLLLQLAALGAVVSVGLGWWAFESVDHDAAGHAVMLRHRAWALPTAGGLVLVALWESWRQAKGLAIWRLSWLLLLLVAGGLLQTARLGGEMVYRHGVGVDAAAFATAAEAPAAPAAETPAGAPVAVPEAPAAAGYEHIHKDGKRHHHSH